jgi:peroxiredoxin
LRNDLGDQVAIIAINVAEPRARLLRFLARHPISYPIALDDNRAITRAWGVYALPTTFVLDRSLRPKWELCAKLGDRI